MFTYEIDPAFAFAVMLFRLPVEEHDLARYIDAIPKLDRRVAGRDSPVLVVELAEGYPAPSAMWRKRLVEARQKLVSKPLVAIAAPSISRAASDPMCPTFTPMDRGFSS